MTYKPTWEEVLDNSNRFIKNQIQFYYFCHFDKYPDESEYLRHFDEITKKLKCELSFFDFGDFENYEKELEDGTRHQI